MTPTRQVFKHIQPLTGGKISPRCHLIGIKTVCTGKVAPARYRYLHIAWGGHDALLSISFNH